MHLKLLEIDWNIAIRPVSKGAPWDCSVKILSVKKGGRAQRRNPNPNPEPWIPLPAASQSGPGTRLSSLREN